MIEQFLEIGFVKETQKWRESDAAITNITTGLSCMASNKVGKAEEYKYYPTYFTDRHYTLVTFDGMITEYTSKKTRPYRDYRLYIHQNTDGKYIDSLFQTSDVKYIQEKVNKIFTTEIRSIKLESILKTS